MVKSHLTDKTPILVIKIEALVTLSVFATALTDHYYSRSEPFNAKIKKKEALKILTTQLRSYGQQGEQMDGFFEASFEESETYQNIYSPAIGWVKKKYPYLITPTNNNQ